MDTKPNNREAPPKTYTVDQQAMMQMLAVVAQAVQKNHVVALALVAIVPDGLLIGEHIVGEQTEKWVHVLRGGIAEVSDRVRENYITKPKEGKSRVTLITPDGATIE